MTDDPTSADPVASLAMVTLDCDDPAAQAEFWSAVLGWDVAHTSDDYAMLTGPSHALGFGRVDGYEAPAWPNPNGTKQFHLDLAVDDLDAAADRCVALGATPPTTSPARPGSSSKTPPATPSASPRPRTGADHPAPLSTAPIPPTGGRDRRSVSELGTWRPTGGRSQVRCGRCGGRACRACRGRCGRGW